MDYKVTGIKPDGTSQELIAASRETEARAEFKNALARSAEFSSIHLAGPDGLDFRQFTHKPKTDLKSQISNPPSPES